MPFSIRRFSRWQLPQRCGPGGEDCAGRRERRPHGGEAVAPGPAVIVFPMEQPQPEPGPMGCRLLEFVFAGFSGELAVVDRRERDQCCAPCSGVSDRRRCTPKPYRARNCSRPRVSNATRARRMEQRSNPRVPSCVAVGANRNGEPSMMVRVEGFEPPCPCERWSLSPLRLPFRHTRLRPAPVATAAGRASLNGGAALAMREMPASPPV